VASPSFTHQPVLREEALGWLALRPGALVVDGTVGGGGHAAEILARTAPGGRLIAFDLDPNALAAAAERLRDAGSRVHFAHASFRELGRVLRELAIDAVDAVLLDLGVSSPQLDEASRGFRFGDATAKQTPLDMRMDPGQETSAAALLASADADELAGWFRDYADLPGAHRLARAIVETRERAPLRSAEDLLALIRASGVGRGRKHNPATLVFQALRIAVNDELGALEEGLGAAVDALRPGGRLVVIAYHSGEDRIVKQRLRAEARGCVCPPRQPVCTCGRKPRLRVLTRRPVKAGEDEIRHNPRARSASLRAAERLADAA
jgi:16S rRNA (cytosine1402-N4)-methyltransferase